MSYQYMHPDEREEMEYQMNARADYLSEAFGAEARMLAAQAEDEYMDQSGFFSREGMRAAGFEDNEKRRARAAIAKAHAPVEDNDVPF